METWARNPLFYRSRVGNMGEGPRSHRSQDRKHVRGTYLGLTYHVSETCTRQCRSTDHELETCVGQWHCTDHELKTCTRELGPNGHALGTCTMDLLIGLTGNELGNMYRTMALHIPRVGNMYNSLVLHRSLWSVYHNILICVQIYRDLVCLTCSVWGAFEEQQP